MTITMTSSMQAMMRCFRRALMSLGYGAGRTANFGGALDQVDQEPCFGMKVKSKQPGGRMPEPGSGFPGRICK